MSKKDTCIIIPCAGKGSRLGIPFSKELFPISFNKTLIDFCFENIYQIRERAVVTLIINGDKTDIIKYCSKYEKDFDIAFIYQKSELKELFGAVKSAEFMFLKYNILLLPDIILNIDLNDIWNNTYSFLESDQRAVWLVEETQKDILKKMGAMEFRNEKNGIAIHNLVEKPDFSGSLDEMLNSFWVSFAFKNEAALKFLQDFKDLYNKSLIFETSIFKNIPGIKVKNAIDLGVWENIRSHMEK